MICERQSALTKFCRHKSLSDHLRQLSDCDARCFNSLITTPKRKHPTRGYFLFERVKGIEPSSSPWKGDIIAIIPYPQNQFFNFEFRILNLYGANLNSNSSVVKNKRYRK